MNTVKDNLVRLFDNKIDSGVKDNPTPNEHGGGSGGGGMMDRLEKRVERLETDVTQIKLDLTKLTIRSEEFATKSGLAELVARSNEFATKGDLHKEISGQTKWIAATIIGVAALCMTAAKFLF
ncbi:MULTISPECIES: hypothetical protein [Winslowiella]|uniref:hypothetical protein n=1 Tax=Winslowiella TaxID=2997349 RepID=UPI0028BF0B61|nr:hypothetical protein [Winslowiella toletana]WNN46240.1 hypothetical protein RIN69_10505 [Winslowiella toletana]